MQCVEYVMHQATRYENKGQNHDDFHWTAAQSKRILDITNEKCVLTVHRQVPRWSQLARL